MSDKKYNKYKSTENEDLDLKESEESLNGEGIREDEDITDTEYEQEDIFDDDDDDEEYDFGEDEDSQETDGIEIIDGDDYKITEKKKPRMRKKKIMSVLLRLLTSVLMLAIAGGIGIFVAVGQQRGGINVYSTKFFESLSHNSWYNLYQNTDITESKFINLNTFARFMGQNALTQYGDVTDFTLEVKEKGDELALVEAKYTVEELGENGETVKHDGTYTFKMKKQEKRILLFYTTWKGYVDEAIIKNCTVEIPSYATVKMDGIELADCLAGTNEETGNAVYKIDRMFMGTHTFTVSAEGMDDIIKDVDMNEDNSSFVLQADQITISGEDKKAVKELSTNILVEYYTAGLNGSDSSSIKALIKEDEASYAHVDEQLEAMKNAINMKDGTTLLNIEFTGIETELTKYVYNESAEVKVTYSASYSAKKSRTVTDGYRRNYKGENKGEATVYFKYIDGKWTASDADVACLDYSIEVAEEG